MGKKRKNKGAQIAIAAAAVVLTAATAGAAGPLGAAILGAELGGTAALGGALGAATTYGSLAGGAVIGGGIGAAAGGASGSLQGDFGRGALMGGAAGAAGGLASGAAGGLAGQGLGALGVDQASSLYSAGTGAASGAAGGAARAAVSGQDAGRAAALGGVGGGITGAFFPQQFDEAGRRIDPTFTESLARGTLGAGVSYGLQQAAPDVFAQPGQSRAGQVAMAAGVPYATEGGRTALAAGLGVGSPEMPGEGGGIPGDKKLEPQRPVWNKSSLRTEEAA